MLGEAGEAQWAKQCSPKVSDLGQLRVSTLPRTQSPAPEGEGLLLPRLGWTTPGGRDYALRFVRETEAQGQPGTSHCFPVHGAELSGGLNSFPPGLGLHDLLLVSLALCFHTPSLPHHTHRPRWQARSGGLDLKGRAPPLPFSSHPPTLLLLPNLPKASSAPAPPANQAWAPVDTQPSLRWGPRLHLCLGPLIRNSWGALSWEERKLGRETRKGGALPRQNLPTCPLPHGSAPVGGPASDTAV